MNFKTTGTCAKSIEFDVEDNGTVVDVKFNGGCPGALSTVARFIEGSNISVAISMLKDVKCGSRDTSCVDQLAQALQQYLDKGITNESE